LNHVSLGNSFNRLILLSTILSQIFLLISLISLIENPYTKYELSIYSFTPIIFWIAVAYGLLSSVFLPFLALQSRRRFPIIITLFNFCIFSFVLLSLYSLRGYPLYLGRGDVSSYIGMARDIGIYGVIPNYNFYPFTSLLISQLGFVIDTDILLIACYVSTFFIINYYLSMYCWSKSILPEKSFVVAAVIASAPIFFAWFSTSIYHNLLTVLTIPLFFYCLQNRSDLRFKILGTILTVSYPFWHPMVAMWIFIYLLILFSFENFFSIQGINKTKISFILLLLSLTSILAWIVHQYSILKSFGRIISQLLGLISTPSSSDQAEYYVHQLVVSETGISSFLPLLMINDEIIYYLLSLASIFYILSVKKHGLRILPIYVIFFIGSLCLIIVFFFARIHSPIRLMNLNSNMIFTPLLVGYLLYIFNQNKDNAKRYLVFALITFALISSMITVYPSPVVMRPNEQIMASDISGMKWLISEKNSNIGVADIMTPIFRFSDLIYGYNFTRGRNDLQRTYVFPNHFGFNENIPLVDRNRYFVISEYDIISYTDVWSDLNKFTNLDFLRLEIIIGVNKLYNNGEFKTYVASI